MVDQHGLLLTGLHAIIYDKTDGRLSTDQHIKILPLYL